MRARLLLSILAALSVASAARGQESFPTAPAGGSGGRPTELAQFQPGLTPGGRGFGLLPGEATKLALYCADLFADGPNERVIFTAPPSDATVTLANGREVGLGEAIDAGLLAVRGRGPRDPGPRPAGQWYEVVMANTGSETVSVSLPAGTLFVPRGQPVPEITPGIRRLFAAAAAGGLLGTDTLAHAVWATRGFTRADVEQTGLASLTDEQARGVQALLRAADLGYDFAKASADYARLYQQRQDELAPQATSVQGTALLPDGRTAGVTVLSDRSGQALLKLAGAKGAAPLFYAAHVLSRRPDRLEIELLHLKTGRPLQAAPGPLTVKLASD
jgi:hypothetical protein